MTKWLTKGGLKAIFTDMAMAPVNLSRGVYKAAEKKGEKSLGKPLSMGVHMPGLFIGTSTAFAAGPVAGIVAYLALTNVFSCALSALNPEAKQALYPKISAYAATFK